MRPVQPVTELLKSWIENGLQNAMKIHKRKFIWVKDHSGIQGIEEVDRRANLEAYEGGDIGGTCTTN